MQRTREMENAKKNQCLRKTVENGKVWKTEKLGDGKV